MTDIRETEEYKSGRYSIVHCPVCGNETLDWYFICEECGWEYDPYAADDPAECSDANGSSIEDYKAEYLRLKAADPDYSWGGSFDGGAARKAPAEPDRGR